MSTGRKRPERPDRRTADPAGQLPQCFSRRLVTRPLRMPKTMRDTPTPGADYGCRTGTSAPESLKTPSSWNESNTNYPWLDTGHAAAGGARILTAAHHGVGKRNAGAACQPRRHRRPRGAQPCRCVGSPSEAPPQPHP